MILAVGNKKGGVGKTTLAFNIAIALSLCGQDVLLIDGDDSQQSAAALTRIRDSKREGGAGYTAVTLHGAAVRTEARKLAPKYDQIVIDAGGTDNAGLRAALAVADVVLIPVEPRSMSLWAVDQTAELVREAREINERLRAIAVLNMADPQGTDNAEAAAYLAGIEGIEVAPYWLTRRKVYANSASLGLSIFEIADPQQKEAIAKAREDFAHLTSLLFDGLITQAPEAAAPKVAAGSF